MRTGNECIDIVTPVLNSEKTIVEFLDAIEEEIPVNQIIFVDGGSEDATLPLIRGHNLSNEHKIKIFIRPDLNLGQARYFGIQQVTTRFWAWIDSDVIVQKGWYRAMLDEIQKNKQVMAVETDKIEFYSFLSHCEKHRRLFGGNLFRLEVKNMVKPSQWDIYCLEDQILQKIIEDNGGVIGRINEPFVHHKSSFWRYEDCEHIVYRYGGDKWIYIAEGIVKKKHNMTNFISHTVYSFWMPFRIWYDMSRKGFWRFMGYCFSDYYEPRLKKIMIFKNQNWSKEIKMVCKECGKRIRNPTKFVFLKSGGFCLECYEHMISYDR
jgi:glycosyltransferase involved in cell wall biosynthesis